MKVLYIVFVVLLATLVTVLGQDVPDASDMDLDDSDPDTDVDPLPDDETAPTLDVEPPKVEKVDYSRPTIAKGTTHFHETFDDINDYVKRWVKSQAKKDGADSAIAKYNGVWEVEEPSDSQLIGDQSLVLKSKAHHHAIASALDRTFQFSGKPFIIQYEVRFKNGMECGGAYVKLLTKQPNQDLKQLHDKTPYTIMFGPDKCGNDHKLHFIFRHKNPITGEFTEKHAKKPTETLDSYFTDKKTHVYRLVVNPDNTFEVSVDGTTVNEGSLLKDVEPAVNPPKEIDDPEDKKPQDWDDKQKIKDPDAEKPADWDENAPEKIEDANAEKPEGWLDDEPDLVADPDAQKPDDWDEEMDGEWEAPKIDNAKCVDAPGCGEWKRPLIVNPDYKGKWTAPFIDNPNYQGVWKPRIIPNPQFFEDLHPYKMSPIAAIGLELWSMTDEIVFDNFLITDDPKVADDWTRETFHVKSKQEKAGSPTSGQSVVGAIMEATNERPWLWAVIILVVVLPIVLIIAYCCFSGSKPDDIAAMRKKTDEVSADDVKEDEEEEEVKTAGDVRAGGDGPKKSRGDLEADEETSQKSDEEPKTSDKEDDEAQAEGEDEVDKEGSNHGSPRQSPRKRKTRKE